MEKWEKGKHVLFKWNQEVYKIVNIISDQKIVLENIKDGSITSQPKEELIYIYNL
jgi:hypothetical protein